MSLSILSSLAVIGGVAAQAAQPVSFSQAKPTSAFNVPANFVGFGFETSAFNNYTNELSLNLIKSVANRMSVPPVIRIGGTTGDNVVYDPAQTKQNATCTGEGCQYSSTSHFVLGPGWFKGFTSFQGSRMSFQAPLGNPLNVSNTLDIVEGAYKALGRDRLSAIAIGNEVATNYSEPTAAGYVRAAHTLQNAIIDRLNLTGDDRRIFEVLDLASGQVTDDDPAWTFQDAFRAGLDDNNFTKIAAEHYYQVVSSDHPTKPFDLQALLMNHTAITARFKSFSPAIDFLNGDAALDGIRYVLSETGSALVGGLAFNNVLGSCLWSVDFHLYAASVGVKRVAGTQRPSSYHSLWTPNATPDFTSPQVRANYYAQPFVADFLGNETGTARSVVEMGLRSDVLTAYALYLGDGLARVALLNMREWNRSGGAARPNQTFALNVPQQQQQQQQQQVTVRRLTSAAGAEALGFDVDATQNITWAGEQWAYRADSSGNGQVIGQVQETVRVSDGVARITVADSEAVIVYL